MMTDQYYAEHLNQARKHLSYARDHLLNAAKAKMLADGINSAKRECDAYDHTCYAINSIDLLIP